MNKGKLTVGFFLLLGLIVGASVVAGWIVAEKLTAQKIEDLDEEIVDLEGKLNFFDAAKKKLPNDQKLDAAKKRLTKLQKAKEEQGIAAKKDAEKGLNTATIQSPSFTQLEALVSKFALFMQDNGLHVTDLRRGSSGNSAAEFMQIDAKGSYMAIVGAIDAAVSLEQLIVSHLSIEQVHDDGELALKLTYTFNKQEEGREEK